MATTTPGLKAPDDPRVNPGTIEEQITTSIARGFETVLSDKKSAEREMVAAAKELKEAALVMSRVARDAAVASGGGAGVVTPSARHTAISTAVPGRVASAAEEYLHNVRRAEPEDLGAAVRAGGMHALAKARRSDIRSSVFNTISDYVQNTMPESPDRYVQGPDGSMMLMAPGVSMDAHGRFRNEHGRYVSAAEAATAVDGDQASIATHYARSMALRSTGMKVAEAWRSGQPIGRSIMSALPQGALKAAGTAAIVATTAKKAWEWTQGQYAENQKYQEVYGGSNLDQLPERFDRWKTGVGGYFTLMGRGAYEGAWDDAMNMGLRGRQQDQYIGANIGLREMGVNRDQTRDILNTTLEADLGLRGLAESIKQVNTAAREAGMNASRAREIFMKNYEASSSVMFGQEGTKGFAASLTSAQISALPRSMWGVDLTGTFTRGNMDFAYAQRLGQDVTQFRTMANNNPSVRTMMSESQLRQMLERLPSRTGRSIQQVVTEYLATIGGTYSPHVHGAALGQKIEEAGFLRETIQQVVNESLGTNMQASEALIYVGSLFASGGMSGRLAEDASKQVSDFRTTTFGSVNTDPQGNADVMDNFVSYRDSGDSNRKGLETAYLNMLAGNSGPNADGNFAGLRQGGTRYPVVEALIAGANDMGLSDETMVQVETKENGKTVFKVVPLKEALFYFPDQIQSGKARIVGGASDEYMDQSTTDALGISPEAVEGIAVDNGSSGRAYEGGQDAGEYYKERAQSGEEGDHGTTNVTIGLDPRVQQLLTVLVNGSPYSPSSGNYGGTAPELPTGP